MQKYSVQKLANIAGVSVRTLHLYDESGLLKPGSRTEAGHRVYGEKELLRLQQILFYKELDMPLKQIATILDDDSFDLLEALNNHKSLITEKAKRIDALLITLNKTINYLKEGGSMLTPEELYEGFSKKDADNFRKEAVEKYGTEAIEDSEKALKKMNKQQFAYLKAEQKEIAETLFKIKDLDPTSREVQKEIAKHYNNIRKFWGTEHNKDKQGDAYAGLGKLYESDERFTMIDGIHQPGYASFLSRAMEHYAKMNLY